MSYEPKDNSGTLFKNDYKKSENQPDYKGKCVVGGQEWEIGGWIKDGQKGKFIAFKFSPPWKPEQKDSEVILTRASDIRIGHEDSDDDLNDLIPF